MEMNMKQFKKINSVAGWLESSGKTNYMRYLNGERLSCKEAILAKCAECCAGYHDGRMDCGMNDCPLYPFMPYGSIKQKFRQRVPKEEAS